MFKDTKYTGSHCSYMSNCWSRAYRIGIFLIFALLLGCFIDAVIQSAPQHAVIAAASTVLLLLMICKKRMKHRMLELKIAKFVPDVYVTPDDKTKSIIVHVTASNYASCILKQVWECEDSSPYAPDSGSCNSDGELINMRLPSSIKMGTELALKLPMPAKGKDGCTKFGLKLYVPMLGRKIIVKICPYSCCMCYHVVHCWWSKRY